MDWVDNLKVACSDFTLYIAFRAKINDSQDDDDEEDEEGVEEEDDDEEEWDERLDEDKDESKAMLSKWKKRNNGRMQ